MAPVTERIEELERALATGEADLAAAAATILEAVDADRVSLAAIDEQAETFEIVEVRGEALLGRGTRFPLETSTHHARAASGSVFVAEDFDGHRGFSRPLDRIVRAHGFRSGGSLPLEHDDGVRGALNLHWNEVGRNAARASDLLEPLLGGLSAALAQPEQVATTTVLVCHDDPLVGRGIARLLEESGTLRAELVPSHREALATGPLRAPDVLVVDEDLEGRRVDRWVGELREAGVDAPLLVLVRRDSSESLAAALAAGAAGYVPHAEAEASLHLAVDTVARGQTWLPSRSAGRADGQLTPRELQVLEGLDRGLRFRQLADTLGVSVTTTKTHARSLFRKLDASSRAEATYEARRRGLLP
jgi:two-component system nitrate/nitrite response regulator NarL